MSLKTEKKRGLGLTILGWLEIIFSGAGFLLTAFYYREKTTAMRPWMKRFRGYDTMAA